MVTRLRALIGDDTARASLVGAYLFFAVAGTVVGKAGRDALFLSRFTASELIAADTVTTVTIAAAVWLQLRLTARVSTRMMLAIWPLAFALGDLLLWAGVGSSAAPMLVPMAFLWIGVQGCFCGPYAALIAARLLTAPEARRRCAVVGGGAILGWIGGGWVTGLVAVHAGATTLLLADGVFTALCAAIAWVSWTHERPEPAHASAVADPRAGLRQSVVVVWHSRHLRAIALMAFLSAAVTTIAGLQFRAIASQSIRDPDQLAAFFGAFNLRAGLLALACQLVLTARVLDLIGVGALAIAPSVVGAASVALWWSGTLSAATLLKGADQTVRYSIDRSTIDRLYRPFSEHEVLEGKTIIDALVSRLGDTVGAAMALLGTGVLHLGMRSLAGISVALLVPWVAAVMVVRREYRTRLLQVLHREPRAPTPRRGPREAQPRAGGVLDRDPAVRLATLRALSRAALSRWRSRPADSRLVMVLDGEIVGLAVLADSIAHAPDGDRRARQGEGAEAIERIARLLFLTAPDRYPACLFSAVDAEGHLEPAALEYLDAALDGPRRRLLVSTIERWNTCSVR